MRIEEDVPLRALSTLRVGGPARYLARIKSDSELEAALRFAKERKLPWYVLGHGTNVLPPQKGYEGLVIKMETEKISYTREGSALSLYAKAGASWERVVNLAADLEAWGIENLAGIPGTIGAAPVQNIGAYGTELKDTFSFADVFDTDRMRHVRLFLQDCEFGYRDSVFRHRPELIITGVGLTLHPDTGPILSYPDLKALHLTGTDLSTVRLVAHAVRMIRAKKFPNMHVCGTAGSFFKNPIVSSAAHKKLLALYPNLPGFTHGDMVKIPLAFVLDHILHLKGYARGAVRLFEAQPLVLVTEDGAQTHDVELFVEEIKKKIFDITGIIVEQEVRTMTNKRK